MKAYDLQVSTPGSLSLAAECLLPEICPAPAGLVPNYLWQPVGEQTFSTYNQRPYWSFVTLEAISTPFTFYSKLMNYRKSQDNIGTV